MLLTIKWKENNTHINILFIFSAEHWTTTPLNTIIILE